MKFIFSVITALALAVSAVASDTNSSSLYNAKEFSLSLGTGYVLDSSAAFQQPYAFSLSAGTTYFITRNIGVEAWVPFYSTKGVSVQEVQVGALFRLPLDRDVRLLKNFAPYVGLGGVYNWETDSTWGYIAKLGTEVRLNKKWGAFVEGQYRNDQFKTWGDGQVNLFGGIKLVF